MDKSHDLDNLAQLVRQFGLILYYGRDGAALAFRYRLPSPVKRALRNRRRGLARLMAQGDIRLCPAPGAHRQQWRYAGQGRFQCEICRGIDAPLGMWKLVS